MANINATKFLPGSTATEPEKKTRAKPTIIPKRDLIVIRNRVIKVRDLVKNTTLLSEKETERKRIETEEEKFDAKEKKLEEKPDEKGEDKKSKIPGLPKLGFFDRIKNFFFKVLLGYVAVRLLPNINKLPDIVGKIGSAIDFGTDLALGLFNGLASFIDWGYKAYDATRGFLKSFGGDNVVKLFDGFGDAVNKVIDATIIAALALTSLGGDDGFGGGAGKRGFDKSGRRVGKNLQERYARRFGREQFLERFGRRNLRNLSGGMRGGVRGTAKSVLGFVRPLLKRIPLPVVGALIDFGLSFALKEDPGRAAFKAIGAGLLGFIGGAIGAAGGPLSIAGAILGSFAGEWAGGAIYDLFFGGKKPTPQKTTKAATGGQVTRGGKPVGGTVTRTIKKAKRTIKVQPTKVKPGASVGGEEKIKKIFPEVKTGDKGKKVNTLGYMKSSYDKSSSISGFGGLFGIHSKAQLGQKPSDLDYQNAAAGLNAWMQRTFSSEIMRTGGAFAEGGSVDVGMFGSGEDMTNMIAKSLEDNISPKMNDIFNDLQKQLMLEKDKDIEKKGDTQFKDEEGGEVSLEGSGDPIELGARVAKRLMKDFGLSDFQAAGAVGNFLNEGMSQGTGDMREGMVRGVPTYNGPDTMGYGWAQWTNTEGGGPNDRLNRALIYLGMKDKPRAWTNEDNYKVLKWELQGPYKSVIDQMKNAKSVDEATMIWLTKFEGINDGTGSKRINSAKQVVPKIAQVKSTNLTEEVSVGETSATLKGKFGLLSLGGSSAPGGDRTLNASSTFSSTHLHHNKSDSDGHNSDLAAQGFGPPRDYVITRGDKSKDRGAPIPAGISGIAKRVGGSVNIVDIVGKNGEKLARFMHNDTIKVSDGQKVSPNTIISTQGSAGTGMVHVHLQASPQNQTRWIKGITKSYFRGGRISIPTFATLAEKGPEFVFDADTTAGLDSMTPNLLEYLNAAKTKSQLMGVLQSYAGYETGAEEVIEVIIPQSQMVPLPIPMPSGIGGFGGMSGGSSDSSYDSLYAGS